MSIIRIITQYTHASCTWLAACGGIGLLPAPGTVATILVGIPVSLALNTYGPQSMRAALGALSVMTLIAYFIIQVALTVLPAAIPPAIRSVYHRTQQDTHDPSWIVLDEVVGFCWASIGIPLTIPSCIGALLLFRFFDITKLGPIGWSEQLPGAAGILADDIIAGLCARLILYLLFCS
jgi:phosphatidylglycerophosphatase A